MRNDAIADCPTSFLRVRTPAAVLLARDLKTLIALLVCLAKRLRDHGRNNTQEATMKHDSETVHKHSKSHKTPAGTE